MKFISTVTLHSPVLQQWTRTSDRSVGSATMKTIIKMPGLGVIMRILVGVGFTIGTLALTESQEHVKSLFAVIA